MRQEDLGSLGAEWTRDWRVSPLPPEGEATGGCRVGEETQGGGDDG